VQGAELDKRIKLFDTYPFYLKGIPCIVFMGGYIKNFLAKTDTAGKINYELLTKQTQLAFLTLWNSANE
jgi:hypothetical protein